MALPEVPAWDVIRAVHCPARCVYTLREAAGLPGMPRTIQPPLRQCSTRQANPPAPAGTLATHFPAYRDRPAWQPWQYPAPSKQREQPVGHCSQGKRVAVRQAAAGECVAWGGSGRQQPGRQLVPAGQCIGQCTEGIQAARAPCAGACARHVHIRAHLLTHAGLVEKVAPPAAASAAPSGAACRAQPTVGGAAGCRRACCSAELDQRPVTSLVHAAEAGS